MIPLPHRLLALLGAVAADELLGEPPAHLHPVVGMGRVVSALLPRMPRAPRAAAFVSGAALAIALPAGCAIATEALAALARDVSFLGLVFEIYVLKSCFALRALGQAALRVGADLRRDGGLDDARRGLASLCSRNAADLTAEELAGATIESVAENLSDSFVAPLLAYAAFGLPGAVIYRAVNTLDAMIGYRGEYEYLGKASARLDDLLNLVPARLTAGLLLAAARLGGGDARRGLAILRRDRGRTASPNAGWPMAAMAGILGVELTKREHYRLGDALEPLTAAAIDRAWKIARTAAALAVAVTAALLFARSG